MGYRSGAYAKIWSVDRGEKSTKIRISTSKKNKQTNEYEQDFSGFVTMAGTAHRDAANLKEGDRIKIGECDVTSRYDKDKKREYINFVMYTFEMADGQSAAPAADSTPASDATPAASNADPDDELPF